MAREYFRPLGLVHGPDAQAAVTSGQGAWLAGSSITAFTLVEVIKRQAGTVSRSLHPYKAVAGDCAALMGARGTFAGVDIRQPRVMGVVNVTPDSFSDGGLHEGEEAGIGHGLKLARDGAAILDVGGESTRAGSETVDPAIELKRVDGVVKTLAKAGHCVSIDTRKASVMRAAMEGGAAIINDVSALTYDSDALAVAAKLKTPVVLMHAQGDPRTMQLNPQYDDVALDVYDYLEGRVEACLKAGIARDNICVDPGIGFGKTLRHNLDLMQQVTLFHGLGVAVLIGVSRKGMIGALTGEKLAINRVGGSVGGALHAALNGIHVIRVHDVKETVAALAVALGMAHPDVTDS